MTQEHRMTPWTRRLFAAAMVGIALGASSAVEAQTPAVLADFETDAGGFSGPIRRDADVAHTGGASGRIDADLSGDARWVTCSVPLEWVNELQYVEFYARSDQADGITVRLADASGQSHLFRPTFKADGKWHRVRIEDFKAVQTWGGADDGTFHWPAKKLLILVEESHLAPAEKGAVWIDDLTVGVRGEAKTLTDVLTAVELGDFEDDTDGFKGTIRRDGEVAKTGKASGRIDFAGTGRWVTATRPLDFANEIRLLQFYVRSETATGLTLRLVDDTGQVHQYRPKVVPDGKWHLIKHTAFDGGQTWGGANDKRFHWPAKTLGFLLEKGYLGGAEAGTLWIDGVRAFVQGEPTSLLDECERVMLADFESDTEGFSGPITQTEAAGAITADFTRDGRWVTCTKTLELPRELRQIRFRAKSDAVSGVTFRLIDKTGQTHQTRPSWPADGKWHEVTISNFTGWQSWGGANDKQVHWPVQKVAFVLEKPNLGEAGKGTLYVDALEAWAVPGTIVPDFEVEQERLGNVFMTGEKARLPIRTKADRLEWTVTDFWLDEVASGTTPVQDGRGVIAPGLDRNGYFLVRIRPFAGEREMATRYTSYAVIPPVEVADPDRSPFGVMTHFAQGMDADIMDLFVKAGIVSIRDEHYWAQVEKKRGEFTFPPRSDRYMAAAKARGIDPLIAMTFANPLYDDGLTPHTPEGRDAYGRYGQAILNQYGDQIKWLEVWNEYNGTWCKGPAAEDRPKYYTQMLKVAYEHIKQVRPDVKVLGGACVLIPTGYLKGIFEHGGLDYMDAVVIHPYREQPEGVEEEIAELEAMIRKYNDGKDVPIWVTECGRYDHREYEWEKGKKMWEKGRARVARYLPRMYTLLLTRNVEKAYWYLCRDHMNFKTMGLLRHVNDAMGRYAVAPAYVSYATLIRQLNGAEYVEREAVRPYTRMYVQHFRRGDQNVRVCWATEPTQVRLFTDKPLKVVDMVGVERVVEPADGTVTLDLGRACYYVLGEVDRVEEVVTGPRVIADSGDDYARTQGENNWYYGYYDGDGDGEGDGRKPAGAYTDDDFELLKIALDAWGYKWKGPSRWLSLGHPDMIDGKQAWPVRRWKSNYAGTVRVTGRFKHHKKGDGVEGRILLDGKEVFRKPVGGQKGPETVAFDLELNIRQGSLLDVAITPGPPGSNTEQDASNVEVRILAPK